MSERVELELPLASDWVGVVRIVMGGIGERFPGSVSGGSVDRERLAAMVLDDLAELAALEAIVHPHVQAARQEFIDEHRDAPALLFEIPLLFETGGETHFDKVIVVSAPPDVQRQRVLARPGMTADKLDAILARQLPDEDKRARADLMIDTGADLSTTQTQVGDILACLGIPPVDKGRGWEQNACAKSCSTRKPRA